MKKEKRYRKKKVDSLVDEAKKRLSDKPKDIGHDLKHHKEVWNNCKKIVEKENIAVDMDVLKIAAFWHDVIIRRVKKVSKDEVEEVCEYLENKMSSMNFDKSFIQRTTKTIEQHEFLDKPETLECLVLQDADKLEVLSLDRWRRSYRAYESGRMKKETLAYYLKTGLDWLPIIVASFYFDTTKKIADSRIRDNFDSQMYKKYVEEFGFENEYVKVKSDLKKERKSEKIRIVEEKTRKNKARFI